MRGFDLYWYDFTQLLAASPGTREEVRDLLQQGHGIALPKTSYEVLWDRLSEQLGEEGAADAVCEIVVATASPRLFDLVDELWETGSASIRWNDTRLVGLIFDSWDEISELGAYLAEYRRGASADDDAKGGIPPDLALEKDTAASRHIPQRVRDTVWRRDRGACGQCDSSERLAFDHIIPLSKDGASTYRNVQLLCETCNRRKSDATG